MSEKARKKFPKWAIALIIVGIVIIGGVLLLKGCWHLITTVPMVKDDYTVTTQTGGTIEAKYMAMGSYETDYFEVEYKEDKDISKIQIWYPAELKTSEKKYPVVLFVNGTGVGASRYKPVFEHLASWGFIALGNEDPSTWEGKKADATLNWLLEANGDESSIFYQKIDRENIGVTGHSQGGVGVYNTINATEHKDIYKCAVTLSPTEEETAAGIKIPYDPSKTNTPLFMLCGTKNDVISPDNMKKSYDKVNSPKVMAVRKDAVHGDMLFSADGYVTAWFMYYLQGDSEAGKAFVGSNAEILSNSLYQNAQTTL